MQEPEMDKIAEWIYRVISDIDDEDVKSIGAQEVRELTKHFPVP